MKKHFMQFVFLIIHGIFIISCASNKIASEDGSLTKNWDTVNRLLETYCGNPFDDVMADFGNNYVEKENLVDFYSPSNESSITFAVKNETVKGYSYKGSYQDIMKFLEKNQRINTVELQNAVNSWLGFSPELLEDTFDTLVLDSTDKVISVGPSESACIEFTIGIWEPLNSDPTNKQEPKPYIKKAELKGSYTALKDYVVRVPDDSVQIKKIDYKN